MEKVITEGKNVKGIQVAGEKNAVAVAAIVNGIGSIGPVIQEEVIGWLMGGASIEIGMRNSNY